MATNQMENLKEMASAPFGPNSNPLMTREQYVNKIQQIPDFEPQKTDKEAKPLKRAVSLDIAAH